jgi:hypothetical protein
MPYRQRGTPFSVAALAEHLDLALAASEDLKHAMDVHADPNTTLRLELSALTHVLQARQLAGDAVGEGALQPGALSGFLAGTDALEATLSPATPRDKPVKPAAGLVGGCILVADLRSSLASALGTLGQHYSLHPDEDAEIESSSGPMYDDGAVALWAQSPDVD